MDLDFEVICPKCGAKVPGKIPAKSVEKAVASALENAEKVKTSRK